MWDLIIAVPDHCLSFYFILQLFQYAFIKSYPSKLPLVMQQVLLAPQSLNVFSRKTLYFASNEERAFSLLMCTKSITYGPILVFRYSFQHCDNLAWGRGS